MGYHQSGEGQNTGGKLRFMDPWPAREETGAFWKRAVEIKGVWPPSSISRGTSALLSRDGFGQLQLPQMSQCKA